MITTGKALLRCCAGQLPLEARYVHFQNQRSLDQWG